ncbi:hypothetical protein [Marinimicrobium sp. C2-29]|uniref:hypothetical protein n=1 Tax=Marinimicrobium sp. C2-29 TaxID=3139825 RepID=UPI003138D74C
MFVGIVCPNFSGSTVVGSLLEKFEDVWHVGEIWKVRSPNQEEKAFCRECGRQSECSVFTEEFKNELRQLKNEEIVSALKKRMGVKHIVSGDKNPRHYQKFMVVPDKALVLIKNMFSASLSYAMRMKGFSDAPDERERLNFLMEAARVYFLDLRNRIKWCIQEVGRENTVFASPEVLCDMSSDELTAFASELLSESVYIDDCFDPDNIHYIGGNHRVSRGKDPGYFKGQIKSDRRYESVLTDSEKAEISNLYYSKFSLRDLLNDSDSRFLEEWILSDSSG